MDINFKPQTNPNFQAKLIAKARVKSNNQRIDLYSLQNSDFDFCKKLYENLDLKKMYPNLENYEDFEAWRYIIRNGILKVGQRDVVLAVHDKKPCGIMSFLEKGMQIYLSDLAKWRVKPNEDVFHIGKVLMHHLFDVADNKQALNITLYPATATPRGKSCKDFYSQLGFRRSANNSMNLFGADYSMKSKELEKYFDYNKVKNASEVDLDKVLSLNFEETALEKMKKFFYELFDKNALK